MKLILSPAALRGTITPPPGKSQTHRLILAASLAQGESVIENVVLSEDIRATLRCVESLGASWKLSDRILRITGAPRGGRSGELPHFDCGESGSTLRFMIPIALAVCGGGIFTGSARLMERPLKPYFDLFEEKKVEYALDGQTLTVRGHLPAGEYSLPGDVSSQFFSGLLFALPLLSGNSVIIPTGRQESSAYVTMTLCALDTAGIHIPATCSLPPQYHISPTDYTAFHARVEADWSQAAFWTAAAGLGNAVELVGMNEDSLQGDRMILDYGELLRGSGVVCIDISQCPDLAPPLAVWAALRNGETRLERAGRLRFKESDRLAAIVQTLGALGADVREEGDSLILRGKASLPGGVCVDCGNDHRIAMMLAIAATRCEQAITLEGAQCVNKSYPDFWRDYTALGGDICEYLGE